MVWSVATTEPQAETRASAGLATAGISTYFPKFASVHAVRGRIVERCRPLFPGYLFCYWTETWGTIFDARYILGMLMCGEHPAQLRDDVIDELREREGTDGVIHLKGPKRKRRFRKGMLVRFSTGTMSGFYGIVSGMSGEQRVQVLMDLLGRKTPVTVREAELVQA